MRNPLLKLSMLLVAILDILLTTQAAGVSVKVTQVGEGATTIYNIVNGLPDTKNPVVSTDTPKTLTLEAEKGKYYSLQCFADGDKKYEFYSIVKKYTEDGKIKEEIVTPRVVAATGMRRVDFGFKTDTKITEVEYVVTYTNRIRIAFNTPNATEGTLKVEYIDAEGTTKELAAPGDIPVGSTDLILTLTPVDASHTPTAKYNDLRGTNKTIELTKTGNSFKGTIKVKEEDLIEVTITVSFGLDQVLVTFIPPSEKDGTLKITYKDGEKEETLATTGKVLRGTELQLTVTKKDEKKKLVVNAKKEGEEAKPISMTENEKKEWVGKIVADAPLTLTLRFEGDETDVTEALFANVAVYPTPFTDRLCIYSPEGEAHFELFNVQGILLHSGEVRNGEYVLSTSQLPAGAYFVVVTREGQRRTFNLMK